MDNFTPYASLAGGLVIGISATLLLMAGRLAGISGILAGLIPFNSKDGFWRILFIIGLIIGAGFFLVVKGEMPAMNINPYDLSDTAHTILLIVAGLLVGIGTYVGAGCTSGHGICGIGRLSVRSIIATITFVAVAAATVFIMRLFVGG